MAWVIFSSKGLRGPGCSAMATKRDKTSREAESAAEAVCARSMGGKAFVGRLLAQAATTSLMAWFSASLVR
jgi:hypothetical protein